jgi:2-polyprenyl-3-methyl-5-hydroxy-6-metoxy-1,4-benzoquinol methylase
MIRIAFHATTGRSPADALRALLQMDKDLSGIIDETAEAYDGGVHAKHRLTRYPDFFAARVHPGDRVLDIGCGSGSVAHAMARSGAIVVGIDLSAENIAGARRRFAHPNLSFVVGDVTRDLPPDAFDVVVASNILEHLDHRVDFLRTVQGRLAPRHWLIRVPMIDRDWRVPLRQELGLFAFSDPTHFTEYTRETFEAEMTAAGLAVCHLQINWGEIWADVVATKA